jgi:hypothetical protein
VSKNKLRKEKHEEVSKQYVLEVIADITAEIRIQRLSSVSSERYRYVDSLYHSFIVSKQWIDENVTAATDT